MKGTLASVREAISALGARLPRHQPRRRLAALCAALCVLALSGTLFAFSQVGQRPPGPATRADLAPISLP
nr:hypothetical protein [Ktedonobacterales bacterium]